MNKSVRNSLEALHETIVRSIELDLNNPLKKDELQLVLAAYNRYQEDEHDGDNYIFNIDDVDDLKCCVDGGLTAKEIYDMVKLNCKYFTFGRCTTFDRCTYTIIANSDLFTNELRDLLLGYLEDVVWCALKYVSCYNEYAALYEHYVTESVED